MTDNFTRATEKEPKPTKLFESSLSPGYVKFTQDNKSFWIWFNLIGLSLNLLFGILTMYAFRYGRGNDCGGIRIAVLGITCLYAFNFVFQAMCLCRLE
jgi:hypothetical protein